MSASPPPGWYPDPQAPNRWRWWDGEAWTAHVNDPVIASTVNPAAIDQQRSVAKFLRVAVWLQPINLLASVAIANSIVDWFRSIDWGDPESMSEPPPSTEWATLVSPLGLALTVAMILWVYRVGESSIAAGRSQRRTPIWSALALLVPIVNFWFPYQAVRDAVRPRPELERAVLRWWLFYVASTSGAVIAWIVPFVPSGVGAVIVAALVGVGATFAILTGSLTHQVLATFEASRIE